MPSPAAKLKGLFHRRDKSGSHDSHSPPESPTPSSPASASHTGRTSTTTQPTSYESTTPRQAPRIGDKPLANNGARTSTDQQSARQTNATPISTQNGSTSQADGLSNDLQQLDLNKTRQPSDTRPNDGSSNHQPLTLSHGEIAEGDDWHLDQPGQSDGSAGKAAALQQPADPLQDPRIGASSKLENGKYLVKDAVAAPSLEGVIDLSNTEDTTVDERWAPAVTHETVHQQVHHIREEQITREIHTHDVYHRVLPIIDVQVLPARHFVPTGTGEFLEVSEDQIPGRARGQQNWVVAETVSKLTSTSHPTKEPRKFTARKFESTEGDYKEYKGTDGIPRTETTWVHHPELETRSQLSGQTLPFHFGSENPADDGLRIDLPDRVDSNHLPLLAQRNERGEIMATRREDLQVGDQAPPVPAHKVLPGHDTQKAFV